LTLSTPELLEHSLASALSGKLFVFEGADGVGKTTLLRAVRGALGTRGVKCELFAFPGTEDGTIGRVVYELHHRPGAFGVTRLSPASLQALHVAAHVDAIQNRILPALRSGACVLLDRFWWSTWVYGIAAGVQARALKLLIRFERVQWGQVRPDAVFYVLRTLGRPTSPTKIEAEYKRLAEREGKLFRVVTLPNDQSVAHACELALRTIVQATQASLLTGPHAPRRTNTGPSPVQPDIVTRLRKPRPTPVFDTFWRFATERQHIFFRRIEGSSPPWTEDPVLREHKFTNAYRAADRVSQYFIRNVIYEGDPSPNEVFFRALLFKLFNKIETWEYLVAAIGKPFAGGFRLGRYDALLARARSEGRTIYSSAYIMPSGAGPDRSAYKHEVHLRLLERMLHDQVARMLMEAPSLEAAFRILRAYAGLGDFLAYQYAIDLNYSPLLGFDEMDFVVPGPGALNGLRKCFTDLGDLSNADAIRWVADNQEREFALRGLNFRDLWGRRLHLIDCQNLFCEVDKYARVVHPGAAGIDARTRIKQRFRPTLAPIRYWFPPKWRINDRLFGS
jgi:hypothetical protein